MAAACKPSAAWVVWADSNPFCEFRIDSTHLVSWHVTCGSKTVRLVAEDPSEVTVSYYFNSVQTDGIRSLLHSCCRGYNMFCHCNSDTVFERESFHFLFSLIFRGWLLENHPFKLWLGSISGNSPVLYVRTYNTYIEYTYPMSMSI